VGLGWAKKEKCMDVLVMLVGGIMVIIGELLFITRDTKPVTLEVVQEGNRAIVLMLFGLFIFSLGVVI
jgi:hypothetical protein